MCGFIGFSASRYLTPLSVTERLQRGLHWIRRRGPDSQRCWSSLDGRVHLGFARLAIVDQDESAHQPLEAPEFGITVALNGEIYNYNELRRELDSFPFRTRSDTEVLLATFVRWGFPGLRKLRGMFACVIIDSRTKRLYLARDPIGKKPLFLLKGVNVAVFGSSVLSIVAAYDEMCELNGKVVAKFWSNDYVPPDDSIVKSCHPVLPGQVLELDWNGEVVREYSCRPPRAEIPDHDERDTIELCGELIRQSVYRRLHNNPRPLTLLSGGIDSTVVTQAMFSHGGGEALTMASRLRLSPDERYARYAAKKIGITLHDLRISARSLAEDVRWTLSLQDEPLGMISFFLLSHLVKAAKQHGRILLTGDGGDEVFLGYGTASDWYATSVEEKSTDTARWTVGVPPPSWMSSWGRYIVREQLLGHMFPKLDRAAAEQGVETRSPLLDWDLLCFARQLPPDRLLGERGLKSLLKSQLLDWPGWFLERPKVGFTFHLRWLWLLTRFAGVRELISPEAIDTFDESIPMSLRKHPCKWTTSEIFVNFRVAWKLLVWSEFLQRFRRASQLKSNSPNVVNVTQATVI